MTQAALGKTFRRFADLIDVEQIRYAVTGALAVRAYIQERETSDIDVLVGAQEVDRVVSLALDSTFELSRERGDDVTVLRDPKTRIEVHVRAPAGKSDVAALEHSVWARVLGRRALVPPPEYLAIMEIASLRGQRKHWEDIINMLCAGDIDVSFVTAHLAREHPGLVSLFEGLVSEARRRGIVEALRKPAVRARSKGAHPRGPKSS